MSFPFNCLDCLFGSSPAKHSDSNFTHAALSTGRQVGSLCTIDEPSSVPGDVSTSEALGRLPQPVASARVRTNNLIRGQTHWRQRARDREALCGLHRKRRLHEGRASIYRWLLCVKLRPIARLKMNQPAQVIPLPAGFLVIFQAHRIGRRVYQSSYVPSTNGNILHRIVL